MSKEVITDHGEDIIVREDTAKAFRWNRFIVIVLAGMIIIFAVAMLFFSGAFTAVQPNLNPSNSANQDRNPGP
jgi:hypothetical protein